MTNMGQCTSAHTTALTQNWKSALDSLQGRCQRDGDPDVRQHATAEVGHLALWVGHREQPCGVGHHLATDGARRRARACHFMASHLRFAICNLRFAICDLRFAICDYFVLRFAIISFCVLRLFVFVNTIQTKSPLKTRMVMCVVANTLSPRAHHAHTHTPTHTCAQTYARV
jgi:hypothetical protein